MSSISAFDLDHTLIKTNSSLLFYRHLIRRKYFSRFSYIRCLIYVVKHKFFGMTLQDLHQAAFKEFLQGKSLSMIEAEVKVFLEDNFSKFLYTPAINRLRKSQEEGHHTVILSTAPAFLVGPIAAYLGIPQWSASHYATDEEGNLKSVDSVLLGEGKADHLMKLAEKHQTTREHITAYSDSLLDLPFLAAAGKAIVVNPDEKMRRLSEENLWEVI